MDIRYKMYPYPVLAYFLDDYKDKHVVNRVEIIIFF